MNSHDPFESIFDSASADLRSQLNDSPVPDFAPRPRIVAPVAAVVAALVVLGTIGFAQFRSSDSNVNVTDTPADEQNDQVADPQPDTSTPDDAAPESPPSTVDISERDMSLLTTAPEDVEITLGMDTTPPASNRPRPELAQSTNDPAYNSVVTRLTNAGGRFDRVASNQRQLINSDNSLMLTHFEDGSQEAMIVRSVATGGLITELPIGDDTEPIWHPTNPQLVRHISGGNASTGSLQLLETDIASNQTRVIADLTERVQSSQPTATHFVSGFGAPSTDGNTWSWIVRDDAESPIEILTYDLANDRILAEHTDLDIRDAGIPIDPIIEEALTETRPILRSVTTTPNGTHVVVEFEEFTIAYPITFVGNLVQIPNLFDSATVATAANGNDAYIYIDFNTASPDNGYLVSVDLETTERTRLFDLFDEANTSIELSGGIAAAPGWIIASTFDCKVDQAWTCNKVLALELAGEQRIVPLAHTYGCGESFLTEPLAIANNDFTAIYFNSDSGSCGEDAEIYEVQVPAVLRDIATTSTE